MSIRQPIVCVLGHVDSGKTLLLDKIRNSSVQAREAGGMTQHIGASFFPIGTLKEISGPLLEKLGGDIKIPGLLVVDTPGHEVFANLRRRGGGVADIAILVIDILRGFEAQTFESMEILRSRKTPFLVAANKIDRIHGWKPIIGASFSETYEMQDSYVRRDLDEHLYEIIGKFSQLSFRADRFDRINDFKRTIAIIPTSAVTGEGIPELIAILTGLTQEYLKDRLKTTEGPARGTVLEVKEEVGLGVTVNVIVYDGTLRKNDLVVLGGKSKPIVTTVRAILLPKPLDEIRDPRDKFSSVDEVSAASGIKIAAPGLDEALAGAPLYAVPSRDSLERYVEEVSEEIQRIKISTEIEGIVLKTDALGSLEAAAESLRANDVPIRMADVGDVSKRDVLEAAIVKDRSSLFGVILVFNARVLPDAEIEAEDRKVPIFRNNIVYHLIDDYLEWMRKEKETQESWEFQRLVKPAKMKFIPGYVFRKAKPAIIGIEILSGKITPKIHLTNNQGKDLGEIQQIQDKGEAVHNAEAGKEVAISMDKPVVGRHFNEGDVLYTMIPEPHAKLLLTKFKENLNNEEIKTLEEYVHIMRKTIPFWGA